MGIRRIITVDEEKHGLRRTASEVARVDGRIHRLLDDMIETMRQAPGVGLAAPQIGVDLRAIVVETPIDEDDPEAGTRVHALLNPRIVFTSETRVEGQEACLSIPALYGDVLRHDALTVRALDRDGRTVEIECRNYEARVFQHEIDHLEGILFTDRVTGFDKLYTLVEDKDGEFVKVAYDPTRTLQYR